MSLGSPLLYCDPLRPFSVDATALGVEPGAMDGLPWARVFEDMAALEAGAVANPDEQRQVGHYWLRAPELAPTEVVSGLIRSTREAVERFAGDVSAGRITADGAPFSHVLHVGIGGSALGPQLVVDALADGRGLPVSFLDNTDPDGIERVLRRIGPDLATTLVVVVSKSGGTPETANAAELVKQRFAQRGLAPGPRMVAITQEGSALDRQAEAEGWAARFPMWDWVGGRTSVTSAVGLLPAALAGVDVAAFLRGAADTDRATRARSWAENPAALLAGGAYVVGRGRGDRHLVALPYSDRLVLLSRYLQQAVMESLGKRHDLGGAEVFQGLTVFGNKGSTDQHAYVQQLRDGRNDFFVWFVQVLSDGIGSRAPVAPGANAGDFLQGFLLGTRRALADAGRPSVVITVPEVSAYELGGLVALIERVVGFYGSLVGINAYHQPGVEAGKRAARDVLDLAARIREALPTVPTSASVIARALDADEVVVWHLLQRMATSGSVARVGQGREATFRAIGEGRA